MKWKGIVKRNALALLLVLLASVELVYCTSTNDGNAPIRGEAGGKR